LSEMCPITLTSPQFLFQQITRRQRTKCRIWCVSVRRNRESSSKWDSVE